ncbi:YtxH domain-containing protein [Aerococcaceae bacterium 50-4]
MKKFITGILFGAVAGAGYALLKTPHSGTENRERLKNYIDDVTYATNDLTGSIAQAQNAVTDLAQQGLSSAKIARDEITLALNDFNQSTAPQISAIQKQVAKLQNDLSAVDIRSNDENAEN